MTFLSRPFLDLTDVQAMTALLIKLRTAGLIDRWPSIAQLRAISTTPHDGWTIHLWTNEAQTLVAFALLDTTYGSLYFYVHPDHESADLSMEIIAWAQLPLPHSTS